MTANTTISAPWHFWAVAVLMVLWNGLAAFDYVLSVALGDAYFALSGMTEAQVAYFRGLPTWVSVAWTVSVWGGVAGGVLFLLRRRLSAILLSASVVGTLGYIAYTYALSDGRSAMGDLWPMPAIVAAIMACLVGYVGFLGRRGIIR